MKYMKFKEKDVTIGCCTNEVISEEPNLEHWEMKIMRVKANEI